MNDELKQFLEGIQDDNQGNENPFASIEGEQPEVEPNEPQIEAPDQDEIKPHNRRERRLLERLQAEREASIQMAARLEALSEVKKATEQLPDKIAAIERIYGVDTPETREATAILRDALLEIKEQAKREVLEEYEARSTREQEAVAEAENILDSMLDDLEDEFNVDLTSPEAEQERINFYRMLERMSPKDSQGDIVNYADHYAVFEAYQARKTALGTTNPAKELAARGMTDGNGGVSKSNIQTDAIERFLKENGII